MTWNILTITPQREFTAVADLANYGFTVYLPIIKQTIRRGRVRSRVEVHRPLFPGYLFLKDRDDRQSLVHASRGVRGYLMCGDGPATLSEAAIASVRAVEEKVLALGKAKPKNPFNVGDRVRVNNPTHPAHLLTGILQRLDKSDRAMIKLISPSLAVAVDTDVAWLELA